jgi:hypothetical protein
MSAVIVYSVDRLQDGYWLQTDGVLDGTWQSSVLSHKRDDVWRYRNGQVLVLQAAQCCNSVVVRQARSDGAIIGLACSGALLSRPTSLP